MPLLLGLAFATAGLDVLSPRSAAVLAWADGWVAAYIAGCARVVGRLPFAQISSPRGLAALVAVLLVAVSLRPAQ
jgi:hypothetical protein